jgi:transposase InsO family protein
MSTLHYDYELKPWRKYGYATGSDAFTCCFDARAGRSTSNALRDYIVRKGWRFGPKCLVAGEPQSCGRKIRLLTIVDVFSRESVAPEVDFGFKSPQVVDVLRSAVKARGVPQRIYCDNGPEFVSLHLDQWAHWNHVQLDFSRPGRPSDNAFCESFNNRVRQELLNPNWFACLDDARLQARVWRRDYNTNHPHSSLGDLSPEEFARQSANNPQQAAIFRDPVV